MHEDFYSSVDLQLEALRSEGLLKRERILTSPQSREIRVSAGPVLNFCANNYLGLANAPEIREAARAAIDRHGVGMASVRFICGTQDAHKELEQRLAAFIGTEDCILYSSCFDANAGLFETLLGAEDAVISDSLNHASIIDGIRLSKARRYRYQHNDLDQLESMLAQARNEGARHLLITTDGVFSMDGEIARLREIVALGERYDALVHVDDSHATGVLGARGRGSHEHCGVLGRIDIITSTLGKSLGGASGGFTAARRPVVELLRQRSRPYLFSNSIAPAVVGASLACLDLLEQSDGALQRLLHQHTEYFRSRLSGCGFVLRGAAHPIVPIMIGDARKAAEMADDLLTEGIYVIGFSFPVVPKGEARIRVQLSAAHTRQDLDHAASAFESVGKRREILPG